MDILLVFCTFPDLDCARRVGTALVTEALAACVNLLPAVESIYQWEGKLETSQEVLAIMKTTQAGYAALEARLKALHPYEVPEIIAIPPSHVQPAYAKWVGDSVAL